MSSEHASQDFAPTRWTLILRARGESAEARAALSELCEAYYQPVCRFLRREGRDHDSTQESAQEFFARVLTRGGFDEANPERGRFRSYLLGALKHFLADQRKHQRRVKRGGTVPTQSLDEPCPGEEDSAAQEIQDRSLPSPEAAFDREWALEVMARALTHLAEDFRASGKNDQFERLKPWLMGDAPSLPQADAARELGLSEGAVKVVIHRLRKRFREAVRNEIAQTLRDPAQVDEELQHLIQALS